MSDQSSNSTLSYQEFLESKAQVGTACGFEPLWIPDFLYGFQKHLDDWAIRKGRAAIYAGCGLGKTPAQLVWAENVIRHTNKPVLIATPLGVSAQTVREADKFGVDCQRSKDGKFSGKRVVVTNYESLRKFNPGDFSGAVFDESGGIKHFDAKRTAEVIEFLRTLQYRLLCTATPSPNDYVELGTSAEALGEMGFQDMATKFFRKTTSKDHRGWGRTKYHLRHYAERDFWRWICSWARACRKPSDLGFDDAAFILPPLTIVEHVVKASVLRPGMLFDMPAITTQEQQEERRRTIPERCGKAAELVSNTGKPAVVWCHLNLEGDLLTKSIPGAVQVSGADSDDSKEEKFLAFSSGQIRVLVTKPTIAAWGLNWQHCAHQTFFTSDSFEQYHQAVRRCWRFGQKSPVHIDVIASEGARGVLDNLNRKAEAAERMFENLVELMNDTLKIRRSNPFTKQSELPSWLNNGTSSVCATPNGSRRSK